MWPANLPTASSMNGSIFYACIARGGRIVVQATNGVVSAQVTTTVEQIVSAVDASVASMKSYAAKNLVYNYETDEGLCCLCVADEAMPRRICFALLRHLRAEMTAREQLSAAFLRGEIEFFATHPDADKLRRVQMEAAEVKDIMLANIESLLTRGEKLEDIERRTDDMRFKSNEFARHSRQVCWDESVCG